MAARPYAYNTKVSVESSRAEMSGILTKHGVMRQGWVTGPEGDQLGFELNGHTYRLNIDMPTKAWATANGGPRQYTSDVISAEWRRRWRANVLLLKAKLEFASEDATTVERELMPYLVTTGGQTLGELVERGAVEQAIGVPLLGDGK